MGQISVAMKSFALTTLVILMLTGATPTLFVYGGQVARDSTAILNCAGLIPSTSGCIGSDLTPFERLVYDSDDDAAYDRGEFVIIPVDPFPAEGTRLADDPRVKYRDANDDNRWTGDGEPIFYDTNGTSQGRIFLIGNPTPSVTLIKDDPLVRFADLNGNGVLNGLVRLTARLESLGGQLSDGSYEDVDGMQIVFTYQPSLLMPVRASYFPEGLFLPDQSHFTMALRNHCLASGGTPWETVVFEESDQDFLSRVSSSSSCLEGPPRTSDVGLGCDPLLVSGCPGEDIDGDGVGDVPLQSLDVLKLDFFIAKFGIFTIDQVVDGPGNPGTSLVDDDGGSAFAHLPVALVNTSFDNAPFFTMAASPLRQDIPQGGSAVFEITLTSVEGFAGNVTLAASVSPLVVSPPTVIVEPLVAVVAARGTAMASVTFGTSPTTSVYLYEITVTGTSGPVFDSTAFFALVTRPVSGLTITGFSHDPPYTFVTEPATLTVSWAGGTGPFACSFDFGDDTVTLTVNVTGRECSGTHIYLVLGTFTVTMRVEGARPGGETALQFIRSVQPEPSLVRGKLSWRHAIKSLEVLTFNARTLNPSNVDLGVRLDVLVDRPDGLQETTSSTTFLIGPGEIRDDMIFGYTPGGGLGKYCFVAVLKYGIDINSDGTLQGSELIGSGDSKTGCFRVS